MREHADAATGPLSKAEQLLGKRSSAQDHPQGVAELSAAIRGVGYAILAVRQELAALREESQQRSGPARR